LVFLDETGLMLQPLRRRTWAPRGHTPVLKTWDRHDRWSVLGVLSLAPWALRLGCYFRFYDHNITAEEVRDFLRRLHRQLRRPLIVVLDRWGVHRKAVRLLTERSADWLRVEWLPGYAPDLNPVEHLWNHTKWGDLANLVPDDADHLYREAHQSLSNQRGDPNRLYSCFRAAGLT
jgi:DDE superfamily endonuclease